MRGGDHAPGARRAAFFLPSAKLDGGQKMTRSETPQCGRDFGRWLAIAALALVLAWVAAPALAQEQPPPPPPEEEEAEEPEGEQEEGEPEEVFAEEIVVTGTRTEGLEPTETLSPIDVVPSQAIAEQATPDMTEALSKIAPSFNVQRFPIADGTAFIRPVTLRNLSPDQTLVLVNGKRRHRSALVNLQLAPLGTVNQGAQAVDFSAIPSNAIDRVEVLRDGAAVLYGSDAIAGVVNVILDESPEGVSVSLQHGEYQEGDGDRNKIGASAGFHLFGSGFLRVSAERDTSDLTSRGNPRPDAAAIAAIVGNEHVAYDGFGQRWGDPDIDTNKLFVNASVNLTE